MNDIADDRETIERASRESGAGKMLDELAMKMRNGQGGQPAPVSRPQSIEDFYVKSSAEIPAATKKVIAALLEYAAKVSVKKMYYSAKDKQWYPFGPDERLEDEQEKIDRSIWRLKEKPFDVETFNLNIRFALKNMILGGIEG